MKLLDVKIPFAGFYESIHSKQIDHEITSCFDVDGDGEMDLTEEKLNDFWFDYSPRNWGIETEYCRQYVEFIAESFELKLTFDEMVSPREYNFQTDRIFAKIPLSEVKKMFRQTKKETLEKLIKSYFTSCDGFISHYSNNLTAWLEKPLSNWDHNEIGTLLEAYIMTKTESEDIYEMTDLAFVMESNTEFYSIVSNNIPQEIWDKYYPKEERA